MAGQTASVSPERPPADCPAHNQASDHLQGREKKRREGTCARETCSRLEGRGRIQATPGLVPGPPDLKLHVMTLAPDYTAEQCSFKGTFSPLILTVTS